MIVYHTSGPRLLDLIYAEHLSILSVNDRDTMARSLNNSSDAWVAYAGETMVGYSGVIPPTILSSTAYFWLYTTRHFSAHRVACARVSRRLVTDALDHYPVLVGHCTGKSARWLHWLGAALGEPQGPLIPFRIEAK